MKTKQINFINSDAEYTPHECFRNALNLANAEGGNIVYGVAIRNICGGYELYSHYVTELDAQYLEGKHESQSGRVNMFLPLHAWTIEEYTEERQLDYDTRGYSDTYYINGIASSIRGVKSRVNNFLTDNKEKGSRPAFGDSGGIKHIFEARDGFTGTPKFGKSIK